MGCTTLVQCYGTPSPAQRIHIWMHASTSSEVTGLQGRKTDNGPIIRATSKGSPAVLSRSTTSLSEL